MVILSPEIILGYSSTHAKVGGQEMNMEDKKREQNRKRENGERERERDSHIQQPSGPVWCAFFGFLLCQGKKEIKGKKGPPTMGALLKSGVLALCIIAVTPPPYIYALWLIQNQHFPAVPFYIPHSFIILPSLIFPFSLFIYLIINIFLSSLLSQSCR